MMVVASVGNSNIPSGVRVMDLQRRMSQLFEMICDAFESNPSSTQGIDLEVVNEAIAVRKELNEIKEALGFPKNDD